MVYAQVHAVEVKHGALVFGILWSSSMSSKSGRLIADLEAEDIVVSFPGGILDIGGIQGGQA